MTDTSSIEWGPAIAVDGKRPGFVRGDDWVLARFSYRAEDGEEYWGTCKAAWRDFSQLDAIRLPADHPHYRQPTPIDWSKPIEAAHEDGRVVPVTLRRDDGESRLPMRIDQTLEDGIEHSIEWFERDGSCNVGGWRIRNVPQPTPQADTKPDLTARMEALVRHAAVNASGYTQDEARAIVALLPEPVDPDEAEAQKLNDDSLYDLTGLDAKHAARNVRYIGATILAAIKRGRALALAGEKEA